MKPKYAIACLAALAFPHFAMGEEEEDKPVKFEDLPVAVATAIKAAAGEAKLDSIVLGDEDGTAAYEAVWQANKHQHEITVAKDGTVMGLEEIITLAEAPEAVRAAMTKAAGDNKIIEVEKVLEKGKTTYEIAFMKGKSKEEVSFSEEGKVLEHEKADEDDEKDEDDDKEEDDDKKDKK